MFRIQNMFPAAKTVTAAAWSVKANNMSYRTDGTDILYRYAYFRTIVLTKVV